MKVLAVLLFLLPWSAACLLLAEDAVAASVRCLGGEAAAETPSAPPVLHVFGGAALKFAVAVDAPLGTRLFLRADLLQTAAGKLSAPVQTDVPVSGELSFEARTHLTAACALPGLPVVQRPTHLLLRLRGVAKDQAAPLSSTTMELWVYPPEVPGEWKKTVAAALAQSGMTRLEVFGRGTRLRQFLKERHVEFEEGGAEWFAVADSHTLYVGDEPPLMPARITSVEGLHLVLFQPPGLPMLLPGVYQQADFKGSVIVKVILPDLLVHLSDDPRGQQTVAAVLRQGLDPRPPAAVNPTPNPNPS